MGMPLSLRAAGTRRPIVVAIPARDEADRIGLCLAALHRQRVRPDTVLLLLNNCTDTTATVSRAMAPGLGFRLVVVIRRLPPPRATAGHARRLAMTFAAAHAGRNGILLTTDADTVPPPDWIARNLAAIDAGADIVCGRALIDAQDARLIPGHLHSDDALERELTGLLDNLAWVLDPEPHDPPPRHTEASGASLAVTACAYRKVGGVPAVRSGEDRAFVAALWRLDAKVRHDPSVLVSVSVRLDGRAAGGMAETLRRRVKRRDGFTDAQLEPAQDTWRRFMLRRQVRLAWRAGQGTDELARVLGMSGESLKHALAQAAFGMAWAAIEAASPPLVRQRVRFSDLEAEIAQAENLLRPLLGSSDVMAAD